MSILNKIKAIIPKISLRWRITFLMGAILLAVTTVLTFISVQNATNNLVIPLIYRDSISINESETQNQEDNIQSFSKESPEYVPHVNMSIKDAQSNFLLYGFLYMLLITAVGMVLVYILAGRAMKPVSTLSDEIKRIDVTNLSKRVNTPQTKDEIHSLSQSFNDLLARLEQSFYQQKMFSASAAHELKTPLATIKTSAQILKLDNEASTDEYRENLDITLQSVQRLIGVVGGLLVLGGEDSQITFESVDLPQMINEINGELAPVYDTKHITLNTDLKVLTLSGNPLLLYRAFFNLIENAYKYTGENGIIEVKSYINSKGIVVDIKDNGIGISEEDISLIFNPFYRAEKSRSRKTAGSGLGLSITKELFNRHNANISISSQKGAGTSVRVEFKE